LLQRAQLSIKTLIVLLEEDQRASTLTPQMLSASLETAEEDMAAVLLAASFILTVMSLEKFAIRMAPKTSTRPLHLADTVINSPLVIPCS